MHCKYCKQEIPDGKYCSNCGRKLEKPDKKPKARGNGQGSVYKEGDTWTASVVKHYFMDENGKRKPKRAKKKGFHTKKEALDYLAVLKSSKIKKVQTLNDYWLGWSTSAMLKKSASKQCAYNLAHTKLDDIFHRKIDTLTIKDLQDAVDAKAPTHYTARDAKALLSHLYKRAVAQGDVMQNLASFIVLPELIEEEAIPFNAEELTALWSLYAQRDRFAPLVLLMIYTGMMPGELRTATADMVDWGNQRIVGCGIKTKKRKITPIVVPDIAVPILRTICDNADGKKIVIGGESKFYSDYYACLDRAGCRKLPPYSCRHTTGTALGVSSVPIAVAKEIMRHTEITTTQRYMHINTETMLAAANKATTQSK